MKYFKEENYLSPFNDYQHEKGCFVFNVICLFCLLFDFAMDKQVQCNI